MKVFDRPKSLVKFNNWEATDAVLKIIEDGHNFIVGRDFFNDFRFAAVQKQKINGKSININPQNALSIKQLLQDFQDLQD